MSTEEAAGAGPFHADTAGLAGSQSDARAIIDTAKAGQIPDSVDEDSPRALVYTVPDQVQVVDLEKFRDAPARKRGTIVAATVESLIAYVRDHMITGSTVWVHPTSGAIVAVLNDHHDEAAWGDHRAKLTLLVTDEWRHWAGKDGVLGSQQDFAEHIEDGAPEIRVPDAADMLEIAQSFHAHTDASFRQASRLDSGAVSLAYDEKVDAKAGTSGHMEVPQEFTLGIAPFVGEEPYEVKARLRYRLSGGTLRIGYKLDRPGDVVRDCLEKIAARLRDEFPDVYLGEPRS